MVRLLALVMFERWRRWRLLPVHGGREIQLSPSRVRHLETEARRAPLIIVASLRWVAEDRIRGLNLLEALRCVRARVLVRVKLQSQRLVLGCDLRVGRALDAAEHRVEVHKLGVDF